jgi:hypothetical protein
MAKAKRKLASILSADVVGYSCLDVVGYLCLMAENEAATVEILTKYRQIFADYIARHDGHIVDSPGRRGHDVPAASSVGIAVEPRTTLRRRSVAGFVWSRNAPPF